VIEKLTTVDINIFDRSALTWLTPYFDLDYSSAGAEERRQWFENLLTVAKHNLSLAHCIQHNHYPHAQVKLKLPEFVGSAYNKTIGCFSNFKSADTMKLNGQILSGTKHWISILELADFGVFRVPAENMEDGVEALVLVDFKSVPNKIDLDFMTPMGMELARPGSLTLDNVEIPKNHILGYRRYTEPSPDFFHLISFSDYCFITNFLGINIGLYKEFQTYLENNGLTQELEFKRIGLELSNLYMTWQDNLNSINIKEPTDDFWHRRNTQYTLSKSILLNQINLILKMGDSRWTDVKSTRTQRFRDALTFCNHMKPLNKNLIEKNFVKF